MSSVQCSHGTLWWLFTTSIIGREMLKIGDIFLIKVQTAQAPLPERSLDFIEVVGSNSNQCSLPSKVLVELVLEVNETVVSGLKTANIIIMGRK